MRFPFAPGLFAAALFSLALTSCDDAPGFDASVFENPAGEAVVRHLHAKLPDFRGEKHIYCIVLGPIPRGANPSFVDRFDDLNIPFVQSDRLSVRPQDNVPYDPKTELSPIFLHVASPTDTLKSGGQIEAAWAYKRTFQKWTLTLAESAPDRWEVTASTLREESLDGSWQPDWQKD